MSSIPIDSPDASDAFERSRDHRRGVRQASVDLEEAIARPAAQDWAKWSAEVAARSRALTEAFRHHAEQSEGPGGLLPEIVATAPRLTHAVDRVRQEHESLLAELDRLQTVVGGKEADDAEKVRQEALRLLNALAAHRQRGSDLIYEAYSVDVEGGDGG